MRRMKDNLFEIDCVVLGLVLVDQFTNILPRYLAYELSLDCHDPAEMDCR